MFDAANHSSIWDVILMVKDDFLKCPNIFTLKHFVKWFQNAQNK